MRSIAVSRFSRVLAALAAAVTLFQAAPAMAQGERLAAECVQEMHETARQTSLSVHALAARGAHLIAAMDTQGATDDQLIETAENTLEAIRRRATAGATRINTLADRCIERLIDIGADDVLIHRVNQARRLSLGAIADEASDSAGFVRAALRRALNN
ncbi:MAG: hypothetical protein KDA31_14225 [Phycisphaerales bacterium]|nr:hypothetical protein [Phycisphaerales bacterium]MCB9837375.1 hypothetical protein [Phycisphaera sp.]